MPKYLLCTYVDSECMAFARSLFVFRHLLVLLVCCCLVHTHIYTSLVHTTHFGSSFQEKDFMARPLTVDKDGRQFRFQNGGQRHKPCILSFGQQEPPKVVAERQKK